MLHTCRATVERMLDQGHSFSKIEDAINAMPIDADSRSALWLYAAARCDEVLFFDTLGVPALVALPGF